MVHLLFDKTDGFLRATCSGTATLDEFMDGMGALAAEARLTGHKRLLVDLRAVKEQFRFTDHFTIGERTAQLLGHLDRVASVVPASRRTGTSEKVATRQGAGLRVFTSIDEAEQWLGE